MNWKETEALPGPVAPPRALLEHRKAPRIGRGAGPAPPQRKSPAEPGLAAAGSRSAPGLLPWILRSRHRLPARMRTPMWLPRVQGAESCSQLAAGAPAGGSAP
ncbi:hypothetical protein AAY473_025578 [Plecturocebus cupreus]